MRLLGALGIGVLILVLKSLSPNVLSQGESTVISVLRTIEATANAATTLSASAASASFAPFFDPPSLPRLPDITP